MPLGERGTTPKHMIYNNIISSAEILSLSFAECGYIAPESISQSDITASIERWITPVVGRSLLEKVNSGEYASLLTTYLQPAIAAAVRVDMQARINMLISQLGNPSATHNRTTAAKELHNEVMLSLRRKLRSLIWMVIEHLESNRSLYPEYSPMCRIKEFVV